MSSEYVLKGLCNNVNILATQDVETNFTGIAVFPVRMVS